jgi:hypothetical protein
MNTVDKILGESEDTLQMFLDLIKTIMDYDLYDGTMEDFRRMQSKAMAQAKAIPGLIGSPIWELVIKNYLTFAHRVTDMEWGLPRNFGPHAKVHHDGRRERLTYLEDYHYDQDQNLKYSVWDAMKSGQFSPHKDLMGSIIGGDPFQEKFTFDMVTPENRPYLEQLAKMFGWDGPEDILDEE